MGRKSAGEVRSGRKGRELEILAPGGKERVRNAGARMGKKGDQYTGTSVGAARNWLSLQVKL